MMTREIIPGRKTEGSTVSSINCDRSSLIFVLKRDVKLQLTNYLHKIFDACQRMARQDFRGKRLSPCQYIDTTRKAIERATTLPLTVFI